MKSYLRSTHIFSMLACAILLNSALTAEITTEQPIEEHVVVGSRPLDPEHIAKMEAQQLQRAYEVEDPQSPPSASELQSSLNRALYQDDGKSAFRLATAQMQTPFTLVGFPISCHWLTWKSGDARHVKIEDGSTWEIASGDLAIVNRWRDDDAIFITPITSWFVSQQYYMMNRTNNTYVKANLVDGPVAFGPYSHWVTHVDSVEGNVYLENNSVWCVDPNDLYILSGRNNSQWALNDHIIVILHDNKYSAYDHLLINVNLNCKVHARPY